MNYSFVYRYIGIMAASVNVRLKKLGVLRQNKHLWGV